MSAPQINVPRRGYRVRINVGIIDDHPAVVFGLLSLINVQPDMRVAATGTSVAELLAESQSFDIVLLDLLLADGSTPTSNLEALVPTGARVLIYSSGERPALIREASRAGGFGMIRKSTSPAETLAAVRAAARGEIAASADWAAALDLDRSFVNEMLSRREAEVLELYASGETAERVGAQLFISRETVLDHIRRIRAKYEAHGRPARTKIDLYRRAVEDGIIGVGGDAAGGHDGAVAASDTDGALVTGRTESTRQGHTR